MSEKNYSLSAQLLHRIALASAVAEFCLDVEQVLYPMDESAAMQGQHVFVAGLARAGTTILMRHLYMTGDFRSLTYRDMPFVLAPNLWARLTARSRRSMAAQERAHGDGILVDFDSPEALEEVFWRVRSGDAYIRQDRLVPMIVDRDVEQAFRRYVASILRSGDTTRYLSKNNNNILRLSGIVSSFPNADVIVPFRSPLQHAMSLLRQHRIFSERQKEDGFALNYMRWLVHHEFGLDHRPFVFSSAASERNQPVEPNSLDYWLRLWHDTYDHVTRTAPEDCVFMSYEQLCDKTEMVWSKLCARLDLKTGAVPALDLRETEIREPYSAELHSACVALYDNLSARAI